MSLDSSKFCIHDIHELPFVLFKQDAAEPGFAAQWEIEMTMLVENGEPFVVVFDQINHDESHEDRKRRGVWLKHNKERLRGVCKALVAIEPDLAHRAMAQAIGKAAMKAFGIPYEAVETREEAIALVQRLTQSDQRGVR